MRSVFVGAQGFVQPNEPYEGILPQSRFVNFHKIETSDSHGSIDVRPHQPHHNTT